VFWKVKVSLHEEYYEDLYRRLCKGNFDAYDCFVSFKGISLAKHPAAKGHFYINLDRPISDNFDVRYIGHMFNDGYEWYINRGYKYLGDLKEWLDENNY
jgi:hypothetical protein